MSMPYRVLLHPRDGRVLRVLLVCRISTERQDERALADQEALLRAWLAERYKGQVEIKVISGRGSGESLFREDAVELERCVRMRLYDLVITEDLGRIFRRLQALFLYEICQDHGVRVIAINDRIDTAEENWKVSGMFATLRHEAYNEDTARRIRRSLRNRFMQVGIVQTHIFGYSKKSGTSSDDGLDKDPAAEVIYDRWFVILEEGGTYSDVSDWLNAECVSTGRWCRSRKWSPKMVARVTHNTILKGIRRRNERMARRVNETGKRKSIKAAPEDLLERECPHLAFIDAERYDRVIRLLKVRNAGYRRKRIDGVDSRAGVPKRHSRWPGGHLVCDCCGAPLVYGAHGQKDNLMCTASREYRCWQSISVHGPTARKKLATAIWDALEGLRDFESVFRREAEAALASTGQDYSKREQELARRDAVLQRQKQNVQKAIREYGPTDLIGEDLKRIQSDETQLAFDRDQLARSRLRADAVPDINAVRELISEALKHECQFSREAARLLRQFVSDIRVSPVQLLDGGNPALRASVTLDFAPPGATDSELRRTLIVDLFEPPQREAVRREVVALRSQGVTEREAARRLKITVTAAQRASVLRRLMDQAGVTDAYRRLTEPPSGTRRFRRHRHPRFDQGGDLTADG
jgi:DNA invertase Pin-like site-specific DNA recombinase